MQGIVYYAYNLYSIIYILLYAWYSLHCFPCIVFDASWSMDLFLNILFYAFSMFTTKYNCDTRHVRRALLKPTRECELKLSEDSFGWRAASAVNAFPLPVRNSNSMKTFKIEVKKWVRENIPLD